MALLLFWPRRHHQRGKICTTRCVLPVCFFFSRCFLRSEDLSNHKQEPSAHQLPLLLHQTGIPKMVPLLVLVGLLSMDSFREMLEHHFMFASVFLYDNLMVLTCLTVAVALVTGMANFINSDFLFDMFFERPGPASLSFRHRALLTWNWIASSIFTSTLVRLVGAAKTGLEGEQFTLVFCFLSLAYLMTYFGASVVWISLRPAIESTPAAASSTSSPTSTSESTRAKLALLIWPMLLLGVSGAVLAWDTSSFVVALISNTVIATTISVAFLCRCISSTCSTSASTSPDSAPTTCSSGKKLAYETEPSEGACGGNGVKTANQDKDEVKDKTEGACGGRGLNSPTAPPSATAAGGLIPMPVPVYEAGEERLGLYMVVAGVPYTPVLIALCLCHSALDPELALRVFAATPMWLLPLCIATHTLFWAGIRRFAALPQYAMPDRSASRTRKRLATYAAPYPNGWYKVADSQELQPGEHKTVDLVGQMLVVFRGASGRVSVLDAYCAHLGANMGIGGRVVGDCMECPFHRWQFGSDGKCETAPYSGVAPPAAAKVRSWPTVEYYGQVLFWFDADERPPTYVPPSIGCLDGGFVYRGKYDTKVNMHLQEFAENSVDFAHFQYLHNNMTIPFTSHEIPGITIKHIANWKMGEGKDSHLSYFEDFASLRVLGWDIPRTDARAVITEVGPSSVAFFHFHTELGEIILFHTHTPEEPAVQRVQFRWFADPSMPRALVWYVVGNWIAQWRNDIMVWENKVFAQRPVLVRGDGPLMKQRRWYSQFYSPNSREAAKAKNALEW